MKDLIKLLPVVAFVAALYYFRNSIADFFKGSPKAAEPAANPKRDMPDTANPGGWGSTKGQAMGPSGPTPSVGDAPPKEIEVPKGIPMQLDRRPPAPPAPPAPIAPVQPPMKAIPQPWSSLSSSGGNLSAALNPLKEPVKAIPAPSSYKGVRGGSLGSIIKEVPSNPLQRTVSSTVIPKGSAAPPVKTGANVFTSSKSGMR